MQSIVHQFFEDIFENLYFRSVPGTTRHASCVQWLVFSWNLIYIGPLQKCTTFKHVQWQESWGALPCNFFFRSNSSSQFCPGEWTSRIVHLLNDQHMGVVTAAASLIDALVKKNPDEYKVGRIRNTYCLHKLIYMSALCLWYQINWWQFFSRAVFPLQSQDYPASWPLPTLISRRVD